MILLIALCAQVYAEIATGETPESTIMDFGSTFMNMIEGKIFGTKDGVKYNKIDEEKHRFSVINQNVELNIGDSSFKDILPKDSTGKQSFIDVDNSGNILKADFAVNEKGGDYFINGIKFQAPPNSRVYYDLEKGFKFSEGTKI
ncbi:MAG: hypothetical protein AABY32_05425, partial [Nanoarchaeota archaeon]